MLHQLDAKELQELLDKRLNKEEFLAAFKQMVEMIKQHQSSNKQELGAVQGRYDQIVSDIKQNYASDMASVKQEALDFVLSENKKMMGEHNTMMAEMDKKMKGMDLNMPLRMDKQMKAMAKDQILPLIPTQKQLEDRLPFMGAKIRDGLEKLKGDDRLDKSAIRGLEEELDKLVRLVNSKPSVSFGGMSGGGSTQVRYYDLSASLDGSTKTFTMPSFLRIIDVKLSSAPVLRPTTDWTSDSSVAQITFTSEIDATTLLASGQSLIVLYAI